MDESLIAALRSEERTIVAELRGSIHFRRLEEIRQLLGLYREQPTIRTSEEPPIGAILDAMLGEHDRRRAPPPAHRPQVIALHGERAIA
ncbi:hypothetical protein [Roseomonas fluvialis]|uniref:Uncharacterized protein n=1 Tax=Roseomonas fluvialis TaxID=1750527 RepID=A0ABM7Y4L8_9PROT|nr:hypothetical protein [Roseomonas fluvialis]BDG72828.1 hypothetical protein Rmf_27570 [Roseomonas fluvialis]